MNITIKQLIYFSLFFWILNFCWSIFAITPNVDDMWYFAPSLGFAYFNELAFHMEKYVYYDFSKFPIFPFLQGFFLKFLLLLNFPINSYTYHLFPFLIFCLLILFTFKLINLLSNNKKNDLLLKKTFFLVLVSVSPISFLFINSRPELLALTFFLLGIFFYLKSKKNLLKNNLNLLLSGFFLSLSIFTHPTFFFLNFFLVFLILFKNFELKIFFFFLTSFSIPLCFFLFYYFNNLPHSLEHLLVASGGFPYFGYFISYIKTIFLNENIYINLINLYYYLPYFLCLIFLLIIYLKRIFKNNYLLKNNETISSILLFSILITLFIERSTYYNHAIFAYLVFLIFISDNYFIKIKLFFHKYIFKLPNFLLGFVIFFIICSWNIVHSLKYYHYQNQYLVNTKFLKFKNSQINNSKKEFVITRSEFVPYFIKEINDNYLLNFKDSKHHWLFPISGRANSEGEITLLKEFVKKKFVEQNTSKYLWIIAKKNIIKKENQFLCISIHDGLGLNPIKIKLEDYSISYNTIKYIVLNPNKISLDCHY